MRPLLAILAVALVIPAPATAQDEEEVRLLLFEQTTTSTPEQPLQIRVGAINETATVYQDLQLTVAVYAPAGSRSEYAQTLTSGSTSPVAARTRTVKGPLQPGEENGRTFPPIELALTGGARNDLHPVTVELRADGGVTPLAVLRTSVVFVVENPEVPLNVSLSFVLDQPIRLRPDGVFLDDGLERSVGPGGRMATIVEALEEIQVPVTLVISPILLVELRDMADGYRVQDQDGVREVPAGQAGAAAAGAMLERLRALAGRLETEFVALPYASPSIPALVDAGLGPDLRTHAERGKALMREILDVEPSAKIFRPPGSALSQSALDFLDLMLGEDGLTEALLVDPEVLGPPDAALLSPPAVAALRTASGPIPVIAPDPILEERTESVPEDPALAAMWTIGELAALYLEQPSLDRGAAIVFSEDETPHPVFLRQLLLGLRPAPGVTVLRPTNASRVVVAETGEEDSPLEERGLQQSSRSASMPQAVTSAIERAREDLGRLEAVQAQPELVDQIASDLLVSESRYLLGREDLALAYVNGARRSVASEFAKIQPPDESLVVTLTSRGGLIPLTIRNEAGYPMRVRIALQSPRLEFLNGSSRDVLLEPPGEHFDFSVRAQTTGRFAVGIQIQTPDGIPIAASTIVVRSTAYNRVALILTIGAALFLAAWWGRRFLPRRKG
jgi:Family of unknown function (DUF6049)